MFRKRGIYGTIGFLALAGAACPGENRLKCAGRGEFFSFVLASAASILLACALPSAAEASVKNLRGEIDIRQGYQSNIDRVPEGEEYEWTTSVTPRLIFSRRAQRSSLSLTYAPSYVYEWEAEEDRIDHSAGLGYDRYLAQRLLWTVDNTFVRSDDPYTYAEFTETDEGDIEISDRRGRRRYWTNRATTELEWEYARESFFGIGYTHAVLRNRDDAFRDYTRHSPFASLSRRFSQRWEADVSYRYTLGDFDDDEDLETHESDLYVYYRTSPMMRYFVHGGYLRNKYEETPRDYTVYTASAGIDRDLSPMRSLSLELGHSWFVRDDASDSDAFYMRAALDNSLRRGTWRIYGESGYDVRYYEGVDDDGLSEYWLAGFRIDHGISQNVAGSLSASYREDRFEERAVNEREKRFSGDIRIAYGFARYYSLYAGYGYTDVDADRETRSYENHRAYVGLSAGKDLLQW